MIRIIFKNVDQGDSVILEWKKNEKWHIGIIDCNLKSDQSNPVLDHVKKNQYSEIDFIVLSHPHHDHFSGLYDLLEHCDSNAIIINHFIHTCLHVYDYLKSALKTSQAIKEITKIFKLVKRLRDQKGLNEGAIYASPFFNIPLSNNVNLSFLSPTSIEHGKYLQNVPYIAPQENQHNNPNANWLSTIIKIQIKNSYVLLTSDAEKYSLIRLDSKQSQSLSGELILGQCPHHGSFRNHNNTFWRKRNPSQSPIPIIISVGNNIYGHANRNVTDFFRNNGFKIYSTNPEGAISILSKNTSNTATTVLNLVSRQIPQNTNSDFYGDKAFEIDGAGKITKI